ncbi:hypothetical protein B0I35DRAFT_78217 [Stachybotrys elegans]|uniref:Carrier domain-containing protein n=1 Tax=Stachybotrys elegans TaxID=80388 RepID=A0A8K0SKB0_9HYPO|nr:hypothetical protein B0I35DRAFT_78217 [Stachybotrys elegans]
MSMSLASMRSTENLWPNAIRSRLSQSTPFATVVGPDGSLENVTFSGLENASNRISWFLQQHCKDDIFFYMGLSDIRCLIWVLAAMKTGKCVVFPSPGNPTAANRKLFLKIGAKKLFIAAELLDNTSALRQATEDIVISQVTPSYSEVMDQDNVVPIYPFTETWDDIKLRRFMALHTSGTSGNPKPIYWNYMGASTFLAFRDEEFSGASGTNLLRQLLVGQRVFLPFPLFHAAGISMLLISVFCHNAVILPRSGTSLSPANVTPILQHGRCNTMFSPPALLESFLVYPSGLSVLATLEHVAYAGGPLQPEKGAQLAKHLKHLFPVIGSTEGGTATLETTSDSSCWDCFNFVDVGQQMQESAPGIYELVYPRGPRVDKAHGYFHVFPDHEQEYRTSDLFSPAPGRDGWWIYRGRTDNWVVMTNGMKIDPTEMENHVSSHPKVKGVVVAGSYRFRLCMLIETTLDDEGDKTALVDEIWPLVEKANQDAPKFGRVPRELIIIGHAKPFRRAAKGTIQRQATISTYQEEIDEAYNRVEMGLLTNDLAPITSTQPKDLIPFLTDLHQQTLDVGDRQIGLDDDLISLGLDSLASFILLARLKAALRQFGVQGQQLDKVHPRLFYSSTTVRRMANSLSDLLTSKDAPPTANSTRPFEEMIEKYAIQAKALAEKNRRSILSSILSSIRSFSLPWYSRKETIILTGSTGSLGSYLLACLLANPLVGRIYCLNRGQPETARTRQEASFKSRRLPPLPAPDDSRLSFIQGSLHEPKMGIPVADYDLLVDQATCVIHNAFPVNWLMDVHSFEPQLIGMMNLLEFMASSKNSARLLFVSSIAAGAPVLDPSGSPKWIPETVMRSDEAPRRLNNQGYAHAKYICERVLEVYSNASLSATNISILRIDQICGSTDSTSPAIWNPAEWLPSLVISSARHVGAVPKSLGSIMGDAVNWVPVDELAKIISNIFATSATDPSHLRAVALAGRGLVVYNITNPHPTLWSDLLPAIDRIVSHRITLQEWIAKVEAADGGDDHLRTLHKNPALKLIDFYKQGLVREGVQGDCQVPMMDTGNMLRASEVARSLKPISVSHMSRWIKSWGL